MVEIRVTQVLNCPRNYQYRLRKEKELPPHFHIIRGNLIHHAIEKALRNKSLPNYDVLLREMQVEKDSYLENQVFGVLILLLKNIQRWIENTKIGLKKDDIIGIEREMKMLVKDDYYLVGHVDLITKTHLVDFKSGRIYKRSHYWMQIGMYRELAKSLKLNGLTEHGDWVLKNVFLGNSMPLEYGPSIKQVEEVLPKYYERLFRLIDIDKKLRDNPKFMAPCEVGWLCKYCSFINNPCRGV